MLSEKSLLPPAIKSEFGLISLDLIDDPQRPMRSDLSPESVADLVMSMRQVGVIEPLVVKKIDERYEVIAGHRRLVAAGIVQLPKVPCYIVEATPEQTELLKIHENLYRADVRPSDEAQHYKFLINHYKLSPSKLAQLIGKSDGYVTDRLAIFEYPTALKEALDKQQIKFSVAKEFSRMTDHKKMIEYLYYSIRNGITAQGAKQWVQDYQRTQENSKAPPLPTANLETTTYDTQMTSKCIYCQQGISLIEANVVYIHTHCLKEVDQTVPDPVPLPDPESQNTA